ncbi:hypothetical protein EV356DRAFT_269675 [Viridothelium virens]|uniref:Uncharacterized protein n=1 Tax=Viridothelium virens TaxID=1048519 RepID=A0A6A6HL00_VIRVR|nr:hypothetical protein EV356DRAFT_269675 [Viridothelium virens]
MRQDEICSSTLHCWSMLSISCLAERCTRISAFVASEPEYSYLSRSMTVANRSRSRLFTPWMLYARVSPISVWRLHFVLSFVHSPHPGG